MRRVLCNNISLDSQGRGKWQPIDLSHALIPLQIITNDNQQNI